MRLFWLCVISFLVNVQFLVTFEYRDDDLEEEYDEEIDNVASVITDALVRDYMYMEDEYQEPKLASPSCQPKFQFTHADVEGVIEKLELILRFFENYLDQLITDGQFGLRICQGILDNALLTLSSTNVYHAKISKLAKYVRQLGDKSLKSMKSKAKPYTLKFIKLIEKPQVFYLPWKNLREFQSYFDRGEA